MKQNSYQVRIEWETNRALWMLGNIFLKGLYSQRQGEGGVSKNWNFGLTSFIRGPLVVIHT